MNAQRFSKDMRLRQSGRFQVIHAEGQRVGDQHLLLIGLRNQLTTTRIGLSVSRKHGSAVHRNRKRRLLREAFRLIRNELPTGIDLILIPRHRSDSTLADYQHALRSLVRRIDRMLPRRKTGGEQIP